MLNSYNWAILFGDYNLFKLLFRNLFKYHDRNTNGLATLTTSYAKKNLLRFWNFPRNIREKQKIKSSVFGSGVVNCQHSTRRYSYLICLILGWAGQEPAEDQHAAAAGRHHAHLRGHRQTDALLRTKVMNWLTQHVWTKNYNFEIKYYGQNKLWQCKRQMLLFSHAFLLILSLYRHQLLLEVLCPLMSVSWSVGRSVCVLREDTFPFSYRVTSIQVFKTPIK